MPLNDFRNPLDDFHQLDLSLVLINGEAVVVHYSKGRNISFKRTLNCVIANMMFAVEDNRSYISISRRPQPYTRNRYNNRHIGYKALVNHVLPFLIDMEWLQFITRGFGDRRDDLIGELASVPDKKRSRRTRYSVTDVFLKQLIDGCLQGATVDYDPGETVLISDINGDLIDYEDDSNTQYIRQTLKAYNSFLGRQMIELPGSDKHQRKTSQNFKRRFKSKFELGGRFYGHWISTLPVEDRKRLLFNGKKVCELDYKAMHPHILYSLKGLDYHDIFNDGDPYRIVGFERLDVKRAFNVALNINARRGFTTAVKNNLKKEGVDVPEKGFSALELRDAVERKFHHVRDCFYSNNINHYGLKCQFVESRLMNEIVLALIRKNICCVPMHDGIIVPVEYRSEAEDIMKNHWVNSSYPGIKLEY